MAEETEDMVDRQCERGSRQERVCDWQEAVGEIRECSCILQNLQMKKTDVLKIEKRRTEMNQ